MNLKVEEFLGETAQAHKLLSALNNKGESFYPEYDVMPLEDMDAARKAGNYHILKATNESGDWLGYVMFHRANTGVAIVDYATNLAPKVSSGKSLEPLVYEKMLSMGVEGVLAEVDTKALGSGARARYFGHVGLVDQDVDYAFLGEDGKHHPYSVLYKSITQKPSKLSVSQLKETFTSYATKVRGYSDEEAKGFFRLKARKKTLDNLHSNKTDVNPLGKPIEIIK